MRPCSDPLWGEARLLLEPGQAVAHRRAPFTIRLKDRLREKSERPLVRVCINPSSKGTDFDGVDEEIPDRPCTVSF